MLWYLGMVIRPHFYINSQKVAWEVYVPAYHYQQFLIAIVLWPILPQRLGACHPDGSYAMINMSENRRPNEMVGQQNLHSLNPPQDISLRSLALATTHSA